MGLFKFIIQKYKQKKIMINTLCDDQIKQMIDALTDYQEIFSTVGFIENSIVADYHNRWEELLSYISNSGNMRKLKHAKCFREYMEKSKEFKQAFLNIDAQIREYNQKLSRSKVEQTKALICPVEGRNLDTQQLSCIVRLAHNHLVIAGAGTGKTTTIIGLIKYLLTEKYTPEDILVLSFTNASATEMAARIEKETEKKLPASTFHKLGINIITQVNGIKPNITQINLRSFIKDKIKGLMANEQYLNLFNSYLLFNRIIAKSEFEFSNQEEYEEYLTLNPPITIKNETVKSYAEMDIANYLNQYNVQYIYENPYKTDTRTSEYGQYYPDFYLPEYDIYIEHFGIDRSGNVPDYFTAKSGKTPSQSYQEAIDWKRNLHRQNNTKLIECFYYEKSEGILLENLKKKLQNNGVVLKLKSAEELWNVIAESNKTILDGVVELFETVINLIKSNNYSISDINEKNQNQPQNRQSNAIIISLIEPLFNEYNKKLKEDNEIDFNDMINLATEYIKAGQFKHRYKYVIVDEYQDISKSRYTLIKSMRDTKDFKLFCVGDDWQSIYRFAGSDIGYILNFEKYWGISEISKIETTYRFSQSLIEISGYFIMFNTAQIKKEIRSRSNAAGFALGEINGYTEKNAIDFMANKLMELPKNSSVFFLGRYSFDVKILETCPLFEYQFNNVTGIITVKYSKRPDLEITFITAHKSKGLQADYVFILNNKKSNMGFPSKIQDSSILSLLLEDFDFFPHAEERRLFYVAITRAKNKVWLLTLNNNESEFVTDLKLKYEKEIKHERFTCPECGGNLIKKTSTYGEFWGCSNYKNNGCKYKRNF